MKRTAVLWLGVACLLLSPRSARSAGAGDAKNCRDSPLFTRIPGYHIHQCRDEAFERYSFASAKGKKTDVEGRYSLLWYQADEGAKPASPIAVIRNHQEAAKGIGGTVVYEDARYTTLKLAKGGQEIWAMIDTAWGKGYQLHVVEKQAMAQEVVANAEVFSNDLKSTGHAAIYGIYFDTGKSEVKPESDAALGEIARLLQQEPGLQLNVVGHTDNVGAMDANLRLSQARAEAVVKALVGGRGVAADRLKAFGVASLAPVAANDNEAGRAKNRRVELVKQ